MYEQAIDFPKQNKKIIVLNKNKHNSHSIKIVFFISANCCIIGIYLFFILFFCKHMETIIIKFINNFKSL